MAQWTRVAAGIHRFDDVANAYALVDGDSALLVDLGSGACLRALPQLGVKRVEAILFTHAHRDQCEGWAEAAASGIRMRFPQAAQTVLDPAVRPDFVLPSPCHLHYPQPIRAPQPVPTAVCDLLPDLAFAFGPWNLTLVAAPGHCPHQLAVLADRGTDIALFCGDALHSHGQIHEGFCTETDHYTGAGARLAADTLCRLRNLRADYVCPSHGPITAVDVWPAFDHTIDRLRHLADLKDTNVPGCPAVRRLVRPEANRFCRLSEHLWLWNNSYCLRSDDGPVLLVDADAVTPEFDAQYRHLFGEAPLEVVLVSHIHCDHVMGIETLRLRHPLACWAHEQLVVGIERPYSLARPWMHDCPTQVDRPLAEAVPVRWHEYELTPYWWPGQTDFHAAYAVTIDGHRALVAGDNYYPPQQWGGTGGLCGFNGGRPELWRQSAELVLQLEPEWILASHMQPFAYRRTDWEAVVAWSHEVADVMRRLSPAGDRERHWNPLWFELRPYVQPASDTLEFTITWPNRSERAAWVAITPRAPAGITVGSGTPPQRVRAGETGRFTWPAAAAPGLVGTRLVTFDVTVDDVRWGELAEGYVRGA